MRAALPLGTRVALLAAVPAAWIATWIARGVSTPAVGGREDFPYPAVLAIGLGAPAGVAAAVAWTGGRSWQPRHVVGITLVASAGMWLSARAILLAPTWMDYLCTGPDTGPHLLFRRITTLFLLRPGGGHRTEVYGAGPAVADAVAAAAYLAGGLWALQSRWRALWAWPVAAFLAMAAGVLAFMLIEGRPALCTT